MKIIHSIENTQTYEEMLSWENDSCIYTRKNLLSGKNHV